MNAWPMPQANGVGHQWPTVRASRDKRTLSTLRASSPRIEQGGRDGRRLQKCVFGADRGLSAGCVAGLVVPPYGLPSTDPAQPGSACHRCLRQLDGGPRGLTPLLTGLGRLTPATNTALREFPLDPLPLRGAPDSRRSPSARPEPDGVLRWRHT